MPRIAYSQSVHRRLRVGAAGLRQPWCSRLLMAAALAALQVVTAGCGRSSGSQDQDPEPPALQRDLQVERMISVLGARGQAWRLWLGSGQVATLSLLGSGRQCATVRMSGPGEIRVGWALHGLSPSEDGLNALMPGTPSLTQAARTTGVALWICGGHDVQPLAEDSQLHVARLEPAEWPLGPAGELTTVLIRLNRHEDWVDPWYVEALARAPLPRDESVSMRLTRGQTTLLSRCTLRPWFADYPRVPSSLSLLLRVE